MPARSSASRNISSGSDSADENEIEYDDEEEIEEDEESDEEDQIQSAGPEEEDDDPPSPPPQPRLKIRLKLPAQPSSNSTPTPAPEEHTSSRLSSKRGRSRDIDVESEDEDDEDNSRSTTSTSVAGPSSRPMTTRQAVLASVVDSTHVSLDEGSRKKKPLNATELALRREETARKRKNLSEKKLEDEKAETINRLLKKQSRPKNKRNALATADDRTPTNAPAGPDEFPDPDDENGRESQTPPVPVMYRWVSSSRLTAAADAMDSGDDNKHMSLSFSIPQSFLPPPPLEDADGTVAMDVDSQISAPRDVVKPVCHIDGCSKERKYRLVKDWTIGACDMQHLKLLESRAR